MTSTSPPAPRRWCRTAGDSHYESLSDAQIAELTRATAAHVNGRALVVAADRAFDTRQAVGFARDCVQWGCDVLMVKPPDWARATTPETLARHYAAVGEVMPVMMVTNVFIPRGEAFGLATVRRTLETTDAVVSVKDDMGGAFARKLALEVADRFAVWAGGQKQNHLNMAPYGMRRGISRRFSPSSPRWRTAIGMRGSAATWPRRCAVIREIDMPLFEFLMQLPGGFDAGMHGLLEIYGLAERCAPAPCHSMTDTEMDQLRAFLARHALL